MNATIKACIFDWGDTLMRDFPDQSGPMCFWDRVEAMPEAVTTLAELSRVLPCHLATNAGESGQREIRAALARVGLSRYITEIFCSREFGCEKPSPRFFAEMVRRLDIAPQELVMVGDSLDKDYRWAVKNGAAAVLYNPSNREVPPGTRQVPSLAGLAELLAPA